MMKKLIAILFMVPLLMATTCDPEDDNYNGYPCTMEARAGLNVTVSLNGNSDIPFDGITVIATDGNYIEELIPIFPDTPQFSGAYERPGNYIVTVSKEGFQTYTSDVISVSSDRCHVIPMQIPIDLVPNP